MFSWLHLPSGSRKGLQERLHGWSCSISDRLAGLQLEPVLESEPEPIQTGRWFVAAGAEAQSHVVGASGQIREARADDGAARLNVPERRLSLPGTGTRKRPLSCQRCVFPPARPKRSTKFSGFFFSISKIFSFFSLSKRCPFFQCSLYDHVWSGEFSKEI